MELRTAPYPYSKMCNVCNVCNALTNKSKRYCTAVFRRNNPTAFAMGFSYFFSASFRGPRKSLIFGERKNDEALISIHRKPLAKSLLTIGIFRRWLLSCILMSRVRLCFGRVVRLLERAEESCEGLKHGYYDLPCVYFLIFLCHSGDIWLVRCLASPPSRLQNHRR